MQAEQSGAGHAVEGVFDVAFKVAQPAAEAALAGLEGLEEACGAGKVQPAKGAQCMKGNDACEGGKKVAGGCGGVCPQASIRRLHPYEEGRGRLGFDKVGSSGNEEEPYGGGRDVGLTAEDAVVGVSAVGAAPLLHQRRKRAEKVLSAV